ncbi:sensor histidine kinase [Aldersonia kunmingensis]|uniref:sensor histidine kinase n=1 Tax=Aldersonia kunmingensis TaxID=408066 RepID=UPI000836F4BC|nr:sensor histidine kinase [Aldersonia kunmingensis]
MPLARQVLALQLTVLVVVIAAGGVLALFDARHDSDEATRDEVTAVAVTLASAPSTVAAVRSANPTALLQPQTEQIRMQTGMDFIVVMAPDRTRFTHTDPDQIGKQFTGTIDRALAGETFTETYAGTLGPSIRAVTPVYDDGQVVALVSAGVTRTKIGSEVTGQLPGILLVVGLGIVVALAGSLLLSRRLRRQTHGMAPAELRAMFEHHEAVLHSVREGLLVFDIDTGRDGYAAVVNDEGRRLLDLPPGPVRRSDLPASLQGLGERNTRDEMHVTPARVLVANQEPVVWGGRTIGTVLTIRDHTELQSVMGELDSVRGFADSLRAQAHESANKLHTVITMVELGRYDAAVEFATAELQLSQHLIDRLTNTVGEPALAALLLGKVDQSAERGVELTVADETALDSTEPLTPHEAVTLVGNLIDNAIDIAAQDDGGWVEVTVTQDDSSLLVQVADSGPGLDADAFAAARARGYSTKTGHHGLGLALVGQLVARHHGSIEAQREPCAAIIVRIPRSAT